MTGEDYFIQCCKEENIDFSTYIKFGSGNIRTSTRYVYKVPLNKRKPSLLFLVKYFEDVGIYIAWDLRMPKALVKTVFSLSKKDVFERQYDRIQVIEKPVEYSGRDYEIVYVFSADGVKEFLRRYLSKESSANS